MIGYCSKPWHEDEAERNYGNHEIDKEEVGKHIADIEQNSNFKSW